MNLDDMIRLAEDQARRIMIGTKDELQPMWLMLNFDGEVEIVATPWASSQEKRVVIETMRRAMRAKQVIAYSLLTEGWMARVVGEEAKEPYTGPPPSERPDRVESVIAMAANHFGEHRYRHWQTIRDRKGRCQELRQINRPEDRIIGVFDNLLDNRGRTHCDGGMGGAH